MSVGTGCQHHCTCSAAALLAPLVAGGPTRSVTVPLATAISDLAVPTLADKILVGRIRTLEPGQPFAEAVAVSDGRITAVGDLHDVEGLKGPGTEVLDLGDGVVYPGLVEPHMHYWASAMLLDWVDCGTRHGTTFDEVVDRLRNAPPTQGDWVLGKLYDPALVEGERALTRDVLDVAIPDRPAVVMNASMHWCYANTLALDAAGIDDTTPDPPGGHFERVDGRLTGAAAEMGAMAMVLLSVPQAPREQLLDSVLRINALAATHGYTRTHDAGTGMVLGAAEVGLFHDLAPRFTGRVSYAVHDSVADAAISAGLVPFAGDDMCRAVSWKFIADGSNQGRSGFQRDDYLGLDVRGAPNYELDQLVDRMRRADGLGWQIMVHANGDAAIDQVLDAYEQVLDGRSGTTLRHRIEHCSFAHADQLDRMAALGLSPSFLMNHLYYWGDAFAERIVGRAKAELLDPVAGAHERGLRPTLHSDYTVTDFEPFREIQTAVTRATRVTGTVLDPSERVGVEDAVRAKTVAAAWQTHCDDVAGTVAPGRLADLVVLDADPMTVEPEAIAGTRVLRTVVGGRTVHEA